jgi:hypothetical protein
VQDAGRDAAHHFLDVRWPGEVEAREARHGRDGIREARRGVGGAD